jgi:phospholipid N-methyltransferase
LRQLYPEIAVAEGDAAQLAQLLESQQIRQPVRAIVSGLPLRSLPLPTVHMIMSSLGNTLASGGTFIQFTYNLLAPLAGLAAEFRKVASRFVWRNIPPARVDVFVKRTRGATDDERMIHATN